MKGRPMKAKKKTIEQIALTDLGIEIEPSVEVVSLAAQSSGRDCQMLDSVDALIEKLRGEAQVL